MLNYSQNISSDQLQEWALKAKQGDPAALTSLLEDASLKELIRSAAAKQHLYAEDFEDVYQEVRLRMSRFIKNW